MLRHLLFSYIYCITGGYVTIFVMEKKIEALKNHSFVQRFNLFERGSLFSLGCFLGLLFLLFSYLVAQDVFDQIDFDTTVRLQDNIPRRLDSWFSSLSLIGSFEVTGITFLITVLLGARKLHRLIVLLTFPLFHVVELLGKTAIEHQGPPFMFLRYNYGFHFPSTYLSTDHFSYPSGHVGRTVFLAGIFAFLIYKTKWSFLYKMIGWGVLAGIVSIMIVSRVYLGEHWLSDTIGGSLLGAAFALFTVMVW